MWFGTNGDILLRLTHDLSSFLAVMRFPNEISCLSALVPNTVVSKLSGVWVGCEEVMPRYSCESEFGRKGGVDGEYVEKGRE
jgi:hypothetical protein